LPTPAELTAFSSLAGRTINATTFTGDSVLSGYSQSDVILGGSGDDVIYPGFGFGNDTMDGNGGSDRIYAYLLGDATLSAATLVTSDNGTDTFSDIEAATLDGNAPFLTVDASTATVPVAIFAGDGTGTSDLTGGPFDDRLIGAASMDVLRGLDGDDFLDGRAEVDDCKGGAGIDTIKNCE